MPGTGPMLIHPFSTMKTNLITLGQGRVLVIIAAVGSLIFLCGCAGLVPQTVTTRIHYDRANGELLITSPKDVTIGSLHTVRATDGSLSVNMTDYAATANAAAIQGAQAEAASRAQLVGLLAQTIPAALGRPVPELPAAGREPSTRSRAAADEETPSAPK